MLLFTLKPAVLIFICKCQKRLDGLPFENEEILKIKYIYIYIYIYLRIL